MKTWLLVWQRAVWLKTNSPSLQLKFNFLQFGEAVELRLHDGILVSPFGQIIVGLGRDAFKYLWGIASSGITTQAPLRLGLGLSRLAGLIELDYSDPTVPI